VFSISLLVSVQCHVYSTGEKINSPEFPCPSGVRPASVHKFVSSALDRSSPNLDHSFPLTSRRKFFGAVPEMGVPAWSGLVTKLLILHPLINSAIHYLLTIWVIQTIL